LQFIVAFSSTGYRLAPQLVQNFWPGFIAAPQTAHIFEADEMGVGAFSTWLGNGALHSRQCVWIPKL
jgi:hypothetical protein